VSLTDRDRKIVLILAPVLLLAAYGFLLLAPKRHEASAAGEQAAKEQQRADRARAELQQLTGAKRDFATDYAQLVRLGKAVPTTLDMPSLVVELDSAARGTGIRFTRVATGDRVEGATGSGSTSTATASSSQPAPGGGSGSRPADAGGAKAQSGPGRATESAGNAVNKGNAASGAADSKSGGASDTQTSTQTGNGKLSVGGGGGAGAGSTAVGAAPPKGLDAVPLALEFQGNFLKLADFFHRLKRFVRVVNDSVTVRGRLLSVDGLKFSSDTQIFPKIKAELTATVYLAPKTEGATAGANPSGPAGAVPAASPPQSDGGSTATPAATATPHQ
jgi:Tfp pilus assembly protein PilO